MIDYLDDHKKAVLLIFFGFMLMLGIWIHDDYGMATSLYLFLVFHSIRFFYLLVSRVWGWKYGLAATLFLWISPRILAHAFFNVKDLAFLSAFIVSLYFTVRFMDKKTVWNALSLALSLAIATNVRIAGLQVLAAVFLFSSLEAIRTRWTLNTWSSPSVLSIATPLMIFVFWPASWSDPLGMVKQALALSINYSRWDGTRVYLGKLVKGQALPWHYIPVWMSVTIPLGYLVLFITGMVAVVKSAVSDFFSRFSQNRHTLFFVFLLFVPILSVIVFRSTLYND